MHVVILGCGRVGSAIAHALDDDGQSIAIIDQDVTAFRRLGPHFTGRTVTGIGFDRDTLREAGIEQASAFAAVSSGDNSNVIAARVARETFGVERVVARIYDPRRAEVYERLGIPTVATVRWSAEQIVRRLTCAEASASWVDPTGSVVVAEVALHPGWVGHRLSEIEQVADVRTVLITRYGEGLLPTRDVLVQEGDIVHVAVQSARLREAGEALAQEPTGSRA